MKGKRVRRISIGLGLATVGTQDDRADRWSRSEIRIRQHGETEDKEVRLLIRNPYEILHLRYALKRIEDEWRRELELLK